MSESYWSVVETVWDEISIYDGPEAFLEQFAGSPHIARLLFAAHWCQAEVLNGGLSQFFGNSTGVLAPEAATAYEAIGMPKAAQILREAMGWFGAPYPRDRGMREGLLDQYFDAQPEAADPFEKLDDRFVDALYEEAGGFEAAANEFAAHRTA